MIHGVAKSQTQLSDSIELNCSEVSMFKVFDTNIFFLYFLSDVLIPSLKILSNYTFIIIFCFNID